MYYNSCTACSKSASVLWLPRLMICSAGTAVQFTTSDSADHNSSTACSKSASMLWLPKLMICSECTATQQTASAAQLAHRLHDDLQCSSSYSADYNSNNACSKSASMLWLPRLMICSAGTAIQCTTTAALPAQSLRPCYGCLS